MISCLFKEKLGSKYSEEGLYSLASYQHLDIPHNLKQILVSSANNSLAKKTWSAYKTAQNNLCKFAEETGCQVDLPLSEGKILAFSAWLLNRGTTAATIETYISGLRSAHLIAGEAPPQLRTPLVTAVIQGKKNSENLVKRSGASSTRLPITPSLLRLMKLELAQLDMKNQDKKMLWAAATVAFSAGLRGGEYLCKEKHYFDPTTMLREKDISLDTLNIEGTNTQIIKIKLKAEKQNKGATASIIDVYPSHNSICPVRAFAKFLDSKPLFYPDMPAFRFQDGTNLTQEKFNKILKIIFKTHLTDINGTISTHSFRIGLASTLGELGFSDDQVMQAGRWSSRAFQAYLKLPRTRRLEMAKAIGNMATS